MKIDFYPKAVEKVLTEIRRKHQILKHITHEVAQSIIEKVRAKLLACPTDEIKKLAAELVPEEIRACLYLLDDHAVSDKAAEIILQRPRKGILIAAWKRWIQNYPGPKNLEDVVRGLIEKLGTDYLIERAIAPQYVTVWLKDSLIPSGVLSHYHQTKGRTGLDAYLFASKIKEEQGLFHAVWHRLLTAGSENQLNSESPDRILMEFVKPTTGGADKVAYGRHYLNVLRKQDKWHEPILNFIATRYGRPANSNQIEDAFWRGVDDDVKDEFLKWYITKQIIDFFEGERADFWRHFVKTRSVRDVLKILDGKGFMLDFGSFGVIEFKDKGNAAYVYPRDVFRFFQSIAVKYTIPTYFKNRNTTVKTSFDPYWDGRIIHSGAWQPGARQRIEGIIKSI
ncbi:MAG TPA: hypothetical protein PLG94_10610 [Smithellaceae bacterium]|jgi:hypothetical protein|nr:hypothetical protein [Syntrophales bacterium]HPL66976.1 hypothetical protein [Smithellaceae bacterium]